MPVDLDELEKLFADWKAHEGPTTFMPLDEALYSAAPSLLAEIREARKRIAELEEGLRPFVEWVSGGVDLADQLQPDLMSFDDDCEVELDDLRNDGFAFLWGDFRRATRLLQPAKETP